MAIVTMGASWMFMSSFTANSNRTAANLAHNALVIMEAKQAVIGWVASQALQTSDNNPGRLPCPEAAGYFGTSNEGIAAGNCTLPAVGRLPWRTLGLDKLRDAAGEPLWYVVSPGWARPNATDTLTINSDTLGTLTLDGVANSAVALVIAPGTAINVSPTAAQQAAGCAARVQTRSPSSLNVLDFLECENATTADGVFATAVAGNATNPVTNDQVRPITTADVLPAVEAAISARLQRDVAPLLEVAYAGTKWGTTTTTPVFPYAAPFADPAASSFAGTAGTTQGLLPFSMSQGCTPGTDPRCLTTLNSWTGSSISQVSGSGSLVGGPTCGMSGGLRYCYGQYSGSAQIRMRDTMSNVAASLRDYDSSGVAGYFYYMDGGGNWITLPRTLTRSFAANGSFDFMVTGDAPNIGSTTYYWFYSGRPTFSDHPLLSSTDPTTGWFVRNEWYRLVYYAFSQNHAPGGTLSCAGAGCVTINASGGTTSYRPAIMVLAGRSLSSAARPNATLGDYLDNPENMNLDAVFQQDRPGRIFNDRVITVGPLS